MTDLIPSSTDRVWDALFTVYEEFGIEVREADASLRITGNPRFVVSRRLKGTRLAHNLDCGQGPFASKIRGLVGGGGPFLD